MDSRDFRGDLDTRPSGQGARAVLEDRSRDVPFIIEDGQIVGRLVYESMRPARRRSTAPI